MVLESKWADAPNEDVKLEQPKNIKHIKKQPQNFASSEETSGRPDGTGKKDRGKKHSSRKTTGSDRSIGAMSGPSRPQNQPQAIRGQSDKVHQLEEHRQEHRHEHRQEHKQEHRHEHRQEHKHGHKQDHRHNHTHQQELQDEHGRDRHQHKQQYKQQNKQQHKQQQHTHQGQNDSEGKRHSNFHPHLHPHPRQHDHRHQHELPRPQTHPQTRLVFSTKDTALKNVKAELVSSKAIPKSDILKQRIEEQRRILEEKQHKKEQDDLLKSFLNGDDTLQWDEDEEDQIIEKLNRSLKV
ncbi:uncharacterized protein ZBIST_4596 [Zygosaccharomyces bailii]|nr:uncharacterized protein ZBIST_4596 [Zygosaccharomyces bailii]